MLRFYGVLMGLMLLGLNYVNGSDLSFTTSTSTLQPPISQNLILRCSLSDSPSSSSSSPPSDHAHSTVNVKYVNSLVITRNGSDIAGITEHFPARVLGNATGVHVTGNISTTDRVKGFIELRWQYPQTDDVGTYTCDVVGVDSNGHGLSFSKSLEIVDSNVTISNVASQIGANWKIMNDLMSKQIILMNSEMNLLRGQNAQLKAALDICRSHDVTQPCPGLTGQCACPSGHYMTNNGNCTAQLAMGSGCTTTHQCAGSHAQCVNGVCGCEKGFSEGLVNSCLQNYALRYYHRRANSSTQVITSPGYPGVYLNGLDYVTSLLADSSKRVRLTFTHFFTEGNSDTVTVYDNAGPSGTKLATLSGHDSSIVGRSFTSSGSYLTVQFHTDSSRVYTGFRATFIAVS